MYTLKTIARRGTALGMASALLVAAVLPGAAVFADALNPLTERSLLLSSSSPGYAFKDGSGNHSGSLNAIGEYYSPPGSGPNGQKTGETFTFTMSSDATAANSLAVKGISLQYCTTAAGNCQAPGNNQGDADPTDDGLTPSTREDNATAHAQTTPRSDLDVVTDGTTPWAEGSTLYDVDTDTGGGNYSVSVDTGSGFVQDTGWIMTTVNAEDTGFLGEDGVQTTGDDALTGKNNYIILTKAAGLDIPAGAEVRIVFNPNKINYITNPGSGSFFVKINTYNTDDYEDAVDSDGDDGDGTKGFTHIWGLADNTHIIDGGVTVANVMTDSIHITTKVLETMSFSVGLENRDTHDLTSPDVHGTCDPIQVVNNNRLNLGNPDAEFSLETGRSWDVYSYWRLSSNSSGGATVYYSGDTLRNTVGDSIEESGASATASLPGTEQFGLAFVDATDDDMGYWTVDHPDDNTNGTNDFYRWDDTNEDTIVDPGEESGLVISDPDDFRLPSLYTLNEVAAYAGGTGTLYNGTGPGTAAFAFLSSSLTVPELIASNNSDVVRCDTAKMRYVGNIAADTPAGVYTTKINYLAAPQY